MPAMRYTVTPVAGLKPSDRRAIAILSCDDDAEIDAGNAFARLKGKGEMDMRARFDHGLIAASSRNTITAGMTHRIRSVTCSSGKTTGSMVFSATQSQRRTQAFRFVFWSVMD